MSKTEKHIISVFEIITLQEEKMRYIVLAYSYVRDYSTAEEIFQECILNLMENREKHRVSNIKAFFASVIKNRCLNYMERERMGGRFGKGAARKEWVDVDIARLSSAGTEETACNIDFPKLIGNCRKRLPELTFDIFMAKRMDRMSYDEISKAFMVSKAKINAEIKKALKVFKEEFKDYKVFGISALVLQFLNML